jgi:hypothetical protein
MAQTIYRVVGRKFAPTYLLEKFANRLCVHWCAEFSANSD